MGGIIEDKIFDVLKGRETRSDAITSDEINARLGKIGYERSPGTLNYHLRKMAYFKQISRARSSEGRYLYWDPR